MGENSGGVVGAHKAAIHVAMLASGAPQPVQWQILAVP